MKLVTELEYRYYLILSFRDNNLKNQAVILRAISDTLQNLIASAKRTILRAPFPITYEQNSNETLLPKKNSSVLPPFLMQFVELRREGSDPTSRQSPRTRTPPMPERRGRRS